MDDMGDRTTEISTHGLQGFYRYVPKALVRQYELEGWEVLEALDGTHHGHHAVLMFMLWREDEDGGSDRAGASAEEHANAGGGSEGEISSGSGDDQD